MLVYASLISSVEFVIHHWLTSGMVTINMSKLGLTSNVYFEVVGLFERVTLIRGVGGQLADLGQELH